MVNLSVTAGASARIGRLAVAGAILVLTFLTYYQFPGHTYLTSDSQIYVPILERYWDPTLFSHDPVATFPHVSYTIYDEITLGIRKLSGADLRNILSCQQLFSRAAGIFGVYLLAESLCGSPLLALLVAGIFSLGTVVAGPSVLTFEYEPVPRATAIPLSLLAIGLLAKRRPAAAAAAGSVAFLYHPAVLYAFWIVYGLCVLWPPGQMGRKRWLAGLAVFSCSVAVLFLLSRNQRGVGEAQSFFGHIDAMKQELLRTRASYLYVSSWGAIRILHHVALWLAGALAYFRLRGEAAPEVKPFLAGLPLIGLLSMPVSYVLLEKWNWELLPQLQPMRALLYGTALAGILAAAAGVKCVQQRRHIDGICWFTLALALCTNANILRIVAPGRSLMNWSRSAVLAALGIAACFVVRTVLTQRRWAVPALACMMVVPFFLLPPFSNIDDRLDLNSPEMKQLAAWARATTSKEAVFHFADAPEAPYPGVFRAEALRAVYVDWKGGSQSVYLHRFRSEWQSRWRSAAEHDWRDPASYASLGIDFVVLEAPHRLQGRVPVFENATFVVYRTALEGVIGNAPGTLRHRPASHGARAAETAQYLSGDT